MISIERDPFIARGSASLAEGARQLWYVDSHGRECFYFCIEQGFFSRRVSLHCAGSFFQQRILAPVDSCLRAK
jgi:hypothetical protein